MSNLLVCDDEKDTRLLVKSLFRGTTTKVDGARNGDEALKKVAKKKYDLMLLDIMMPGTNFEKVADQLAKKSPKLKIALFSVVQYPDAERRRLLRKPNIVAYLQKPIANEELVGSIEGILDMS